MKIDNFVIFLMIITVSSTIDFQKALIIRENNFSDPELVYISLKNCHNLAEFEARLIEFENFRTSYLLNQSISNQIISSINTRFVDYQDMKDLKPIIWLSAPFYDGIILKEEWAPTGDVSTFLYDSIGNLVRQYGTIKIVNVDGRSAYHFDQTNMIIATANVSTQFTFITIYSRPITDNTTTGRFFTASTGDRLFASWKNYRACFFIKEWISFKSPSPPKGISNKIEMFIATNNNGVKNMWDVENQIVIDSTVGDNDWGITVIGRPLMGSSEAANVFVYEAIVFDRVLNAVERKHITSVFRKYYSI